MTIGTGLERVEVTCLRDEVDTIAEWLDAYGSAAQRQPLPVPEHHLRSAGPDYRWSARAWDDLQRRTVHQLALLLADRRVARGSA